MYTILVTGVGAIIGYGIIQSLRKLPQPVKIIGTDIFSDAVGQHWCDHFEKGVLASSSEHTDFIRRTIQKYSIDLVMPGIEQDVLRLAKDFPTLNEGSAQFVLNDLNLIALAQDKWKLHLKLVQEGFHAIQSSIEGTFEELSRKLGLPFLIKPRKSYASKGIEKVHAIEDFEYWKRKLGENFMAQEIVGHDDAEFTVGAFGLGNGACTQKIVFQRKLSGEGATAKAKVAELPELECLVDRLVEVFRPIGPTNLQFRMHHGRYLLLEINPRFSSSTSLRTAFGFNEPAMCIQYYLEHHTPSTNPIRVGSAIRYIEDLVTYDCTHC